MLERINQIKNVGRFYNVLITGTPENDPSFRGFNLIYADNGTGKSTVSTILKSLWRNEPERVIERKTINVDEAIFINIKIDDKEYIFQNDVWNKNPDIKMEIFDEEFVSNNIFSPSGVNVNNRRELFNYVVLGEENVSKVNKVKEIDNYLNSDLKEAIATAESTLETAAQAPNMKALDDTIALEVNALSKMKKDLEEKGRLVKHSERISSEKKLQKLSDFEIINYQSCIAKDLRNLSHVAEYKAHIQQHNSWIQDGIKIVSEIAADRCPFCFQDIKENSAISAYKEFFSEEYRIHRQDVKGKLTLAIQSYANTVITAIETTIEHNNERCAFWHKLDKEIPVTIGLKIELRQTIILFRSALESILTRKKENLLEVITPSGEETSGLALESTFREALKIYNKNIDSLNQKIEALKDANQNIAELKANNDKQKVTLKYNEVLYHLEETKVLYINLKKLREEKKDEERKIKNLRKEISISSQAIIKKYENSINKTLKNFGVEFSIEGIKSKSDRSRTESLHFNIRLRNESFDPNGSGEKPYKLSNTLSSGDKSTLAFALFVAKHQTQDDNPEVQLKLEEELKNTILIFDDPITSLDFFRKQRTSIIIKKFAEKAKQVIVLTHSNQFAKLFSGGKNKRFVELQKDPVCGVSVAIGNRMDDLFTVKYDKHRDDILAYLKAPHSVDKLDVIKAVRPYVETYLKQYRYDFSNLTLGKMIQIFRQECVSEDYLDDLETVNGIIRSDSSHGSNEIGADVLENITPDELTTACRIAIEIAPPSTNNKLAV